MLVTHSCLTLWFHELQSTIFLCPRNSWGQNTWVGSHSLLQLFFLTQGSNPGLSALESDFYSPSHYGNHYSCFLCAHSGTFILTLCDTMDNNPTPRLLLLWDFLGMNSRVGSMPFFWKSYPPNDMNLHLLCLLHFRKNLYLLSFLGNLYRRCACAFQSASPVIAAACSKQCFRVSQHTLWNTTQ